MLFSRGGSRRLRSSDGGSAVPFLLILASLSSLLSSAFARPHHHTHHVPSIRMPSGTTVVSNAMGHLEAMGEIEDETSRLQSTCS